MLVKLKASRPEFKAEKNIDILAGLQLRVRKENLIFLFLNQNIFCGYEKAPKTCVKIDGQENIYNFMPNLFFI